MRKDEYCTKCGGGNIVDDFDREGGCVVAARKCLSCGGRRIEERPVAPREVAEEVKAIEEWVSKKETHKKEVLFMGKSEHKFCSKCIERNPDSTKYAVRQGLCSTCYREAMGITVNDAIRRQKAEAINKPSNKPTIKVATKPVTPTKPEDYGKVLTCDFKDYPELYDKLCVSAKKHFRTPIGEIFASIDDCCTEDNFMFLQNGVRASGLRKEP